MAFLLFFEGARLNLALDEDRHARSKVPLLGREKRSVGNKWVSHKNSDK
jgi:hypothetical protein